MPTHTFKVMGYPPCCVFIFSQWGRVPCCQNTLISAWHALILNVGLLQVFPDFRDGYFWATWSGTIWSSVPNESACPGTWLTWPWQNNGLWRGSEEKLPKWDCLERDHHQAQDYHALDWGAWIWGNSEVSSVEEMLWPKQCPRLDTDTSSSWLQQQFLKV